MTGWEVYWFTRLDALCCTFVILSMVLIVGGSMALLLGPMFINDFCRDEENKKRVLFKWVKIAIPAGLIFGFLSILTPTTKQAAVIYLLPKIANNEQAQKVPENFVKLLNTKMEEWMKDTMKEEKGK